MLEELKRKSEDNSGKSSGDKSTRSRKIEVSKRKKNKNSLSKGKKEKVPNFQENS